MSTANAIEEMSYVGLSGKGYLLVNSTYTT